MPRPLRPLSERRPKRTRITAEQLASLSHELRTPLNGVLGVASLLEGTRLTGEQRAYVSALRESGEHLLHLVNDILDFASLAERKLELHPQAVSAPDLLRNVCELLAPRAREKGLELAWSAAADVGRIHADEARLKQILLNFAGNAVKFTPAGGVLLGVVREGARLRFTVEDTGPGVPADQRERIFDAFAQSAVGDAVLGGSGLGLAIARRLANAMGGELGVDAGRRGGARFWFEAAFPSLDAARPEPLLAGRTLAVVSANSITREATRRQIQGIGGRAISAASPAALAPRLGAADVVLIDYDLPAADIAAAQAFGRPWIALLAPDQRGRLRRRRPPGYAGYLIRPLRPDSLAKRALQAVGVQSATPAAASPPPPDGAAAPGSRVLLVEDNPINAMLARALLAREGCDVVHAPSGEEALAASRIAAFDLILMDMRMPGLSGEQTARALRADGITTPIVALTANAFEDDRQACLAAGMDDFLVKPLLPDALRATLTRWIGAVWTQAPARAKVG